MNVNCAQCQTDFKITQSDQEFYQRIDVPQPTLCPSCRMQRRMTWRNDRTFWVRKCDLTGKQFVSGYPPSPNGSGEAGLQVYTPDAWYGDDWDPLEYGQNIDFSRPFFEQWHELFNKVPRLGIDIINCENSDFCNYCGDDKNCYLDIAGEANEDCYYNLFTKYSKNCADCTFVYESELCYETIHAHNCHNVRYAMYMENCFDCTFSFDLKGCNNCIFSSNLRNKQYCIFNKQYTKEKYEEKIKEFDFGSYQQVQKYILQWKDVMQKAIHRDAYVTQSEDCTGNNIKNSKNCQHAFNITKCENSKFLYDVLDAKECYDLSYSLYDPEHSLELMSTLNMRYSAFSMASHYCYNVYYVDQCNNSHDLFGCIGLNKKQFCILNKQYSEDEYHVLKNKLIEHMQKTGEWGEFFPSQLSPFAYNQTVAQEYFPLTKADCEAKGFIWHEPDFNNHQPHTYNIPDNISDCAYVTDNVLTCINCNKNYKVIEQELKLYQQLDITIPRKCPNCRHRDRMRIRNPRHLWHRQCMCISPEHDNHDGRCATEFETTYSPDRKELVYCESCYQKEIL